MLTLDPVFVVDAAEPDCVILSHTTSAAVSEIEPVPVAVPVLGVRVAQSAVNPEPFSRQNVMLSVACSASVYDAPIAVHVTARGEIAW